MIVSIIVFELEASGGKVWSMVARVASKNIRPFGWYYSPMLGSDA